MHAQIRAACKERDRQVRKSTRRPFMHGRTWAAVKAEGHQHAAGVVGGEAQAVARLGRLQQWRVEAEAELVTSRLFNVGVAW